MTLSEHTIAYSSAISTALKKMNALRDGVILLVVIDDGNKVVGTLSDGDVRRHLERIGHLETAVSEAMNKSFVYINEGESEFGPINKLNREEKKLLPVLNERHELVRLIDLRTYSPKLPISAFIMAGGKGTRLAPLTDKVPKPLLNVGSRPILHHLIAHLNHCGITDVTISLKHFGEQIIEFISNNENIHAQTVTETNALGTAGALALKRNWEHDTVLLLNSDLLTNLDLQSMYAHFFDQGLDLLIASIPYNVSLPYAVIECSGDKVKSISEKPRYTYQSNAGIYLFKKDLLDLIPSDEHYDATDLIKDTLNRSEKVGYFPIKNYWLDIGRHEDYEQAQKDVEKLFP